MIMFWGESNSPDFTASLCSSPSILLSFLFHSLSLLSLLRLICRFTFDNFSVFRSLGLRRGCNKILIKEKFVEDDRRAKILRDCLSKFSAAPGAVWRCWGCWCWEGSRPAEQHLLPATATAPAARTTCAPEHMRKFHKYSIGHKSINDRIKNYGPYIVFISK